MEDEICPYATFHLLGFREEMDPSKAMQFQTFPHQGNGHSGTMGPPVGHPTNASAHSRSGSQSMVQSLSKQLVQNIYLNSGTIDTFCVSTASSERSIL